MVAAVRYPLDWTSHHPTPCSRATLVAKLREMTAQAVASESSHAPRRRARSGAAGRDPEPTGDQAAPRERSATSPSRNAAAAK